MSRRSTIFASATRRARSSSRRPTPTGPPRWTPTSTPPASCASAATSEMCTEEILIKTGGELAAAPGARRHAAAHPRPAGGAVVARRSAVRHEASSREIVGIAGPAAGRLGLVRGTAARRMAGLADGRARGRRRHGHRLAAADAVARAAGRPVRPSAADARAGPHPRRPHRRRAAQPRRCASTKAVYYVGWLAAMLGWEVTKPLSESPMATTVQGTFRRPPPRDQGRDPASRSGYDGAQPRRGLAGACRDRVEPTGPRRPRAHHAPGDHLLATADWNGAQVTRRAGQLEPFNETPFIAEALDRPGMDRIFERSLLRAVHFSGG